MAGAPPGGSAPATLSRAFGGRPGPTSKRAESWRKTQGSARPPRFRCNQDGPESRPGFPLSRGAVGNQIYGIDVCCIATACQRAIEPHEHTRVTDLPPQHPARDVSDVLTPPAHRPEARDLHEVGGDHSPQCHGVSPHERFHACDLERSNRVLFGGSRRRSLRRKGGGEGAEMEGKRRRHRDAAVEMKASLPRSC